MSKRLSLCPYKGGVWLGPVLLLLTMQSQFLLQNLFSWTEASSTQLLKSGTVSQTMLLEQFLIWGSSLLKAVCIGFFWKMVIYNLSVSPSPIDNNNFTELQWTICLVFSILGVLVPYCSQMHIINNPPPLIFACSGPPPPFTIQTNSAFIDETADEETSSAFQEGGDKVKIIKQELVKETEQGATAPADKMPVCRLTYNTHLKLLCQDERLHSA